MPSLDLDAADRVLDAVLDAHALGTDDRPSSAGDKSPARTCRVCGAAVPRPRWRFCSPRCERVMYAPAAEIDLGMHVRRALVLARELRAHLAFRGAPDTTWGDVPPIPVVIDARIDYLERWAEVLDRRAPSSFAWSACPGQAWIESVAGEQLALEIGGRS